MKTRIKMESKMKTRMGIVCNGKPVISVNQLRDAVNSDILSLLWVKYNKPQNTQLRLLIDGEPVNRFHFFGHTSDAFGIGCTMTMVNNAKCIKITGTGKKIKKVYLEVHLV